MEHSAVRPSSVENGCLIGWMTGEFQVVALILCMDAFMMIVIMMMCASENFI